MSAGADGVFISSSTLMRMPSDVRELIVAFVVGHQEGPGGDTDVGKTSGVSDASPRNDTSDDDGFADLTPRQARRYIAGCGERTRAAIEAIARSGTRYFQVKDVAAAVGVAPHELRGVWGGLTRRVKTVTGDADAYLVYWDGSEPVFDDAGTYVDQRGEITELTHTSLRKALGL
ncbi:hypothetical protein SQ03_25010 [Methylobacterium platani JCM 14648]|uniref:Uncharacterized protein n=3 Tax=Methylobacterium platani TaxID=427683 RepID=A0A179SH84_9HYPH|nr:hypothetical protein SQ03_25010 [Methylobacterium platani JCM 14648]OAS26955.1 hypothetical protein A5481_03025 [Methylobacterium platani]